ncbi:transferrin receptor protein 1 [Salmo trutta]|uniref:Transferrin receptor protein 1 n=1 Tax=Salmo trutta TaxID=8032 RepID=A0A673XED3_SALTR|nr:transferrin receptor protein 1-like [Salmo trutta]XP_029582340.1 transferrin receptor protein 1-like [Salmo trutta]XP_029582341.1 transferrin receptor protein 1-like [Salmo trutta]
MDHARSTISKIFNGEPRSYTRFNLTQNMEGENSQVEMKLSSDMDEEVGGNGVGEDLNHAKEPYVVHKPAGRTPKNVCFMVATVLLIFIISYLIGYLSHRKTELAPPSCSRSTFEESITEDSVKMEVDPLMDWKDVKSLLDQKMTASSIESAFSEFASESHQAGSAGDMELANKVLGRFKQYGMHTWTDGHFVKLVDPPASGSNMVTFKGSDLGELRGYLAYSKTGTAKGAVLHGNYGQMDDLGKLQDKNIALDGRVLLVRSGKISFAEKVANAAKLNASAVLIYPAGDRQLGGSTQLFGHVHLGSGDPYTPGFPSFNHTQFPPVQSSGLPSILAQTITVNMAATIMKGMEGTTAPAGWVGVGRLGDDKDMVTVEVNNVLSEKLINNVFGVIKGFVDPDRFVVMGAQRDAWGPGFASSTVGTSVLVELARAISDMVKNDGFKPRRSIVFASWSAGEYGSVGATEWLEGYLSSLNMKAFSYINLDGVVSGFPTFKASASPLMYTLIQRTLREVNTLSDSGTLYSAVPGSNWEAAVMEPLRLNDPAYPFITFSGIPSVSFRFTTEGAEYPYLGTLDDTRDKLYGATSNQVAKLAVSAGQFAGKIALRLVHDHLLHLDVEKYIRQIRTHVVAINSKIQKLQSMQPQVLPKLLSVQWLISATGSYSRAASSLSNEIDNSNLEDVEMCRNINDRIMSVERDFLSPYVSPRETPFRHILVGSGSHTLKALSDHLDALQNDQSDADADLFRIQFALATWTIQGCANSLAGEVWSIDNMI